MVLTLLAAGLACSIPGIEDLPAPVPTEAPTSEPGEPAQDTPAPGPTAAGPQTYTAEGVKHDFAMDGSVCLVYQPVTLVVKDDGSAELSTTGADIIDHANCTEGTSPETWYVNGAVNASTQEVTFQTCNFGHFTASGALSYAGGKLSGQVSCTNKDGIQFIALFIGQ